MYLVDTNVWLELLLEQANEKDVRRFLREVDPTALHMTEFAFYSVGIILLRLKKADLFHRFVRDTLLDGGVGLIRLGPEDMVMLVESSQRFNLDFDDAYLPVCSGRAVRSGFGKFRCRL